MSPFLPFQFLLAHLTRKSNGWATEAPEYFSSMMDTCFLLRGLHNLSMPLGIRRSRRAISFLWAKSSLSRELECSFFSRKDDP